MSAFLVAGGFIGACREDVFDGSSWLSCDAVAVLKVGVVSGRSKHEIVVYGLLF